MPKFVEELLPEPDRDRLKYEIAAELGLAGKIQQVGWPQMPANECGAIGGRIGGNMVKVMVRMAEEALARGQVPPPSPPPA